MAGVSFIPQPNSRNRNVEGRRLDVFWTQLTRIFEMKSVNPARTAFCATTALAVAMFALPAAAQSSGTAFGGSPTATTLNAPWSAVQLAGPGCTGTPVALTTQWTDGTIGGQRGTLTGNQPIVGHNFGAVYSGNGLDVMAGGTLLHPGPSNECASLRFTTPAPGGIYTVAAQFRSVDVHSRTGAGDGVKAMVLHKGVQIGAAVDTRASDVGKVEQSLRLCPGDTVDFAVTMKANMSNDSTGVNATLRRTDKVRPLDCLKVGVPVLTDHDVGNPRNNDLPGKVIDLPKDTMLGRSPCCAPWSEEDIYASLSTPIGANSAAPYTLQYLNPTSLPDQMSAYLNYVHFMTPAITTITMTWQAVNLGSGTNYTTSGTAVGGPQTVTWTWTSSGINVSSGNFWSGTPFQPNIWYGFLTTLSHNGPRDSDFFGPKCLVNWRPFRVQVEQARMAAGADQPLMFQTIGANGRVVQSRAKASSPGRASSIAAAARGD
jgi:hypothetical protein